MSSLSRICLDAGRWIPLLTFTPTKHSRAEVNALDILAPSSCSFHKKGDSILNRNGLFFIKYTFQEMQIGERDFIHTLREAAMVHQDEISGVESWPL